MRKLRLGLALGGGVPPTYRGPHRGYRGGPFEICRHRRRPELREQGRVQNRSPIGFKGLTQGAYLVVYYRNELMTKDTIQSHQGLIGISILGNL